MPTAYQLDATSWQRSLLHRGSELLAHDSHTAICATGSGCLDLWWIVVAARLAHVPFSRDPRLLTYLGVPETLDGEAEVEPPRQFMSLPGECSCFPAENVHAPTG
jgi:hypothetical protein